MIAALITACSTVKKSAASSASTTPVAATTTPVSTTPLVFAKPSDGIYEPGNEDLTAIQTQYKDLTLEKLKEGYSIYTASTCTRCHDAQNIYEIDETDWVNIIDKMARKASITDEQKDAVYKYVLAVKANRHK